jgi:hypothetical protein
VTDTNVFSNTAGADCPSVVVGLYVLVSPTAFEFFSVVLHANLQAVSGGGFFAQSGTLQLVDTRLVSNTASCTCL